MRRCPECGDSSPPLPRWLAVVGGASLSTVLAACYGAAYPHRAETLDHRDDDGDSFILGEDCNDADPAVHPAAGDVASDGVDSDCDGLDEPRPQ